VNDLTPLADAKGLRLTLESPKRSHTALLDPHHIRQVIQNLIDNAIKYTDAGSITLRTSAGEHGMVRIEIADTGRGISPKLIDKLFDQFSRDPSIAKEIAGTGLGLYIARMIVQAHNGSIRALSAGPGKGSTFVIELPSA
jgi:two-component system CheB/CheR fusion protein